MNRLKDMSDSFVVNLICDRSIDVLVVLVEFVALKKEVLLANITILWTEGLKITTKEKGEKVILFQLVRGN